MRELIHCSKQGSRIFSQNSVSQGTDDAPDSLAFCHQSQRTVMCKSIQSICVWAQLHLYFFFVLNCLEPAAISPSSHYVMSQSNVNKKLEAA